MAPISANGNTVGVSHTRPEHNDLVCSSIVPHDPPKSVGSESVANSSTKSDLDRSFPSAKEQKWTRSFDSMLPYNIQKQ